MNYEKKTKGDIKAGVSRAVRALTGGKETHHYLRNLDAPNDSTPESEKTIKRSQDLKDFLLTEDNQKAVNGAISELGESLTRVDRALKFSESLAPPAFPHEQPISPQMLSVH